MLKTDIAQVVVEIVEKIISDRYDEHINHFSERTTDDDRLRVLVKELTSTLNQEQMVVFLTIDELFNEIDNINSRKYFSLGFKDGLSAGRSL